MKKLAEEGVKTIATMTLTTTHTDVKVLTKDIVLCAWKGKGTVTLKAGDKMTYDPDALTLVFRKIDGKWKIAYSHESATIVTENVGKK
jgi:hypothetical protein